MIYEDYDLCRGERIKMRAKFEQECFFQRDYLIGIEKNRSLDLSGLTDEEIEIIECLVKSMKEKNKKMEKY